LPPSPKSPPLSRRREDKDVLPSLSTEVLTSPRSPPLMIRIPSRHHSCYVEVPPVPPRRRTMLRMPPTPEDTPPSRYKRPFDGGKASMPASDFNSLTCSILEIGLSEDELDGYDALPISCLRSTQVGLASSGG
jgi:NAD-dependent histone deacetylase SIR2